MNAFISSSSFSMVYFGQYLALEGQFGHLSLMENIANLLIFPLITIYGNVVFMFNLYFAMILALLQKFIERLEKVPEKDVDRWIFDNLTLFDKFSQKMSQLCLFIIPGLYVDQIIPKFTIIKTF